jgi:hypothetical protein
VSHTAGSYQHVGGWYHQWVALASIPDDQDVYGIKLKTICRGLYTLLQTGLPIEMGLPGFLTHLKCATHVAVSGVLWHLGTTPSFASPLRRKMWWFHSSLRALGHHRIILPLSPTCLPLGVPFSLLGCGDFAMHGLLCFTLHHHMVWILVLL